MTVLMVEPGHTPYETELHGLHDMQAAVGGYIQAIYPFEERVAVVCNEEGVIDGLPFNRSVPGGYGGVFGPFFVCGLGEDDFCSLTKEQTAQYKKQFYQAEILLGLNGNEPVTLKVPPIDKRKPPRAKDRDTPSGRD